MIKEDAWLAGIMKRPVFRLDAGDAAAVAEHKKGRSGFYFTKVDTENVAATKTLLREGFFVADVNVTFAVAPKDIVRASIPAVDVGALPSSKIEEALTVAHDSFKYTRFHLDPLVSKATADLIKKEWVRNYAEKKRGDYLFVGTMGGGVVGFLAALKGHDGEQAIIDLVGVHPDAQRKGVGRAMISRFAEHYANAKELVVGTQVANVPSVRLYESMGFRFKSSTYVLHMHVEDGKIL